MNDHHRNEIASMTNHELIAAINVLTRQVNAKLLVGDRDERREVLEVLKIERMNRGI